MVEESDRKPRAEAAVHSLLQFFWVDLQGRVMEVRLEVFAFLAHGHLAIIRWVSVVEHEELVNSVAAAEEAFE